MKRRANGCLVDKSLIGFTSEKMYDFQRSDITFLRTFDSKKTNTCFYDCHPFKGEIHGVPCKYSNNKFTTWGCFCSMECVKSHILEKNACDPRRDKELSMLALMSTQKYGIHYRLGRSPNKYLLGMFGGPLSIEQYREYSTSNYRYVIKKIDCAETHTVYDVYLDDSSFDRRKVINKKPEIQNDDRKTNLVVRRESTPAHIPKRSIMMLMSKK